MAEGRTKETRKLRIRGRVHRVHVLEHHRRGASLLCRSAPQCLVWSEDVGQGLRLMEEVLKNLERGGDDFQLILPGGPMAGSED